MSAMPAELRGWGFATSVPRSREARKRGQAKHTGIMSRDTLEFALRFDAWASDLPDTPTPEQIQDHWQVSRATSYRWRAAWCDARGRS